jgi:hypothetical protein
VTIGDGLTDAAEVRCPLCEAEFVLSDAAHLATAPDPDGDARPEVIPLTSDVEEPSSTPDLPDELETDVQTGETAESAEEPAAETVDPGEESAEPDDDSAEPDGDSDQPAAEEAVVRARCPCCSAEFGLDEVLLTTTGEPLGRDVVAAITVEGRVRDFSDPTGEIPDFWGLGRRDDAPRINIDLGIPTGTTVSNGAFDFVAGGDDDAAASAATTLGRRRPRQKSMMRELVGIVLGGVAGLAIAYYGLNFFGGPRFDFLEIYLPGIEHTAGHRPSWLPGGKADDADPESAGFAGSELED